VGLEGACQALGLDEQDRGLEDPRLLQALLIDETAALKSASWGMTQILGENFKECGYFAPAPRWR
jgi:hypothetical protein